MTQELIAKLESASEGSRELDAAVASVFSHDVESDDGDFWWGPWDEQSTRVPDFTTSIDAALALAERVLPRWGWDFGKPARMGEHGGQPWADCWPPVEDGEVRAFRLGGPRPTPNHTNAATPALAICAALLRASAAEGAGHE